MKAEVMKLHCVKDKEVAYTMAGMRANSALEIAKTVRTVFSTDYLPEEHMFVISLDTKMHINGIFDMAHGQISACCVSKGDILKRVLITNGSQFVIAHNHPSGDATPSGADIDVTREMIDAANMLDIKCIDHIVIGNNEYVSIREMHPNMF